ncbi:hypothetical protein [Neorhizobium sp. LjRoot104]|uniref:hypothetical protein n=1 Tax=Neorhizobium sp. LjRoot104 TaxID=3342254 RepID=UPI003ECCDC03
MDTHLDRLARAHGINLTKPSPETVEVPVPDSAKRKVLAALGVAVSSEAKNRPHIDEVSRTILRNDHSTTLPSRGSQDGPCVEHLSVSNSVSLYFVSHLVDQIGLDSIFRLAAETPECAKHVGILAGSVRPTQRSFGAGLVPAVADQPECSVRAARRMQIGTPIPTILPE